MIKRSLGRSGIHVSAMGLGCWAIGGPYWHNGNPNGWGKTDDRESLRSLSRGFDLGINFFDTADVYGCGHSEKLVGRFARGKRDKLVIATKFGIAFKEDTKEVIGERSDPAYISTACEASLRRLGTDYIDLYQYHRGNADDGDAVIEVLEELVEEGKIRFYGWSTDTPQRASVFARGLHCTAIQQELSIVSGNEETLRICEENDLASINRGPLGMGILTGKLTHDTTFPDDDVRSGFMKLKEGVFAERLNKSDAVREIVTRGGRTAVQGSLAWLWAKSGATIPIPGIRTVQQVEDNCGALDFGPLSTDEMAEIEVILQN